MKNKIFQLIALGFLAAILETPLISSAQSYYGYETYPYYKNHYHSYNAASVGSINYTPPAPVIAQTPPPVTRAVTVPTDTTTVVTRTLPTSLPKTGFGGGAEKAAENFSLIVVSFAVVAGVIICEFVNRKLRLKTGRK